MKPKTQRHAEATGDSSARERILKTAEQIFAEMGFEGTSLRQVAVNSDVPVALVSYHFKNKLGLYREVFRARDPNTNAQRLAGLALAEMEDNRERRLEMIIKAALMPMLSLRKIEGSANFGVLLAREATDPRSAERGIIKEMFDPAATATIKALKGALPGRSEAEIVWAFQMMIGTMLYIMADGGRAKHLSGGVCDPEDVEGTMRLILPLLLHGMRGPEF
ncbi:TetR/AcrR family transcriptional regulator [Rhizobium fabae]|uniref:AcrR family transcriptional regulator n=1 Tax=Rhizobium fabae TaxID=573179 RepID=A0A7W6BFB7_9HYPH|nr:CerR family C-terminal domain-containing protein [Rhizobium fabae]MBB3919254.1 AcrR family transcriptional regulator [Rhizobium fabae]RUM16542.1 TetR/AcrR family transcriptional regulator [Rhizobium fabae]